MRPAFSSTKQAAAFALLLLGLLLLPAVAGKKILPAREQSYATQSWGSGPYPYIQQQIFDQNEDIDIAFMGSSHILQCLDAPRLQNELGKKLGRPATVRVLAWGGAGYDALYFVAKDLLAHHRVRMLVFYDEHNGTYRNNKSPVWFRFRDDAAALPGLPAGEQAYYYFASLVGMPRNLLCLLRPNLPADMHIPNYWEVHYRAASLVGHLGSTATELGYDPRPTGDVDPNAPFELFTPANSATPADVSIYSPETKQSFEFASAALPAWEVHFMHLIATLAAQHDCQLVLLHIPVMDEIRAPRIEERAFWPDIFGTNLFMLGIPPARMFSGLSDEEVHKLFNNPSHLNKNGQAYFTTLILPSLLQIYDSSSRH